jgi:hypothetical protein
MLEARRTAEEQHSTNNVSCKIATTRSDLQQYHLPYRPNKTRFSTEKAIPK